jgi:hypothetical protein
MKEYEAVKKSRFTEVQVAYALRQAEAGTPVIDVCRGLGISEATFYIWKKKCAVRGHQVALPFSFVCSVTVMEILEDPPVISL